MYNFNLDYDEGVLIESENASWESREDIELTNLVLTNKKIYCIYEKRNGLFKKPTEEVNILSLSDIKIINGQALVQQAKHDGVWCLQIQFRQGTEYFSFSESPKKVVPQWVATINSALGIPIMNTPIAPIPKSTKRSSPFGGVFAGAFADVADSFRSVVDNAAETFGIPTKQGNKPVTPIVNAQSIYTQPIHQTPQATQSQTQHRFCVNCGTLLTMGTKFCPECGCKVENNDTATDATPNVSNAKVGTENVPPIVQEPVQQKPVESKADISSTQRQQEYIGKVYKCPYCGEVVNQSDTVCGSCGYHLSGKQAMGSATDFQQQLLKIEMLRQDKKVGFWDQREALDATDKQMIALIKSYPIPNTIEDIVEFFHLAIGNIDIAKSKKSVFNTDGWDGGSRERAISNAWVGKLQQIYKKAELYFPNELEFAHIKEAYQNMMKELKLS